MAHQHHNRDTAGAAHEDHHTGHQHEHHTHDHKEDTSGARQTNAHTGHGGHSGGGTDHSGHEMMFRNRFWVCLALTIPVLLFSPMIQELFGFTVPEFTGSRLIGPAFAFVIFGYGGVPFLQMAVPEIKGRNPGMMTLISLAICVAFLYSLFALISNTGMDFFWEMATLIDIMLLGHWLEMRSVRQASGALTALTKLLPDTAERIRDDGSLEQIPASALQTGDRVLVRPGASVPADAEIIEGQTTVNESMVTGEATPVEKEPGDTVIAGTINGDGSLRVRVTATGDATALAGIMRLVEEAQRSKSATQILADRAASWLFYIAITVALITAVAWSIAVGFDLMVIERVATVLVIACPHALGLAIPLVVAISTAMGARNGILIRKRPALEDARRITTVVFDKTGTLTEGRFGVTGMVTAEGWTPDQALALAAAVEGDSEHPIAAGISRKASDAGVQPVQISSFEAIKGRGIKAVYDDKTVYMGGPRLLEMHKPQMPDSITAFQRQADENAQTIVYLIVDGQIAAAFALADVVREESKEAIRQLHAMGIEVVMLTGDSRSVAEAVARQLDIDTVFAEVLPEHKDQKIAELQHGDKKVAMVGDGVNDAPALARADIGIAIGSGTDVAIESAAIILVRSNPLDVVKILTLSKATYRKMIQNLIWATGYNIIALPLAAGILAPIGFILSPAVGAAFMSFSTIVVAINAQLLRRLDLSAGAG